MKKIALFLSALLAVSAFGRVGPVSQYGQLQAGKNSSGKGQIYGKCKGVTSGNEVAVQGMSLFWAIASGDAGADFWTASTVDKLVKDQKIQIIRAPMGVDEEWGAGNYFSKMDYYKGLMNTVVQAAIDNDIYVIIDYHSHCAEGDTSKAKQFFGYMAERWGGYDNVIFEIYNEPKNSCGDSWVDASGARTYWVNGIAPYARTILKTIRQYSDNLVVVGTPYYDQYTNAALADPINDNNIAYTFHYYAGEDPYRHTIDNQGKNAEDAMNGGLSVFVSEWGNSAPSGNGGFNASYSTDWYNWMKKHKLSGANWSVSNKKETASYFDGGAWNYSTSGQWVNTNVFASLPSSYTACSTTPTSSSSIASSSSSLPAGYTDYIDDLEDGDGFAYTGGEWYAYTDKGDKGASTISNGPGRNDGYNVVISGSTAGNSSKYVAGVTGVKLSQGDNPYDPYVALGVALNENQTAYDLSACTEISYKYKGASHNFKAEDTGVTDYGYHQITKAASSTWTTATVSWDLLVQESWAEPVTLSKKRIAKFTWEIKGSQPANNYLYIDDVRCSGLAFKPVPSPTSSSSSAKSSSSMSSSSVASSSSVQSSSSAKVQTLFQLTSGNADQTVTAGNSIKSIVYSIKNVTKVSVDGLPAGLMGAINKSNTNFTISGTVADSLKDKEYVYTIAVTGVDSNTTATGKITVKHKPVKTTLSVTSNATQTVTAGDSIKPIVFSYANMDSVKLTGIPQGTLTIAQNKNAKTLTVAGAVSEGLSDGEYTASMTVYGPDNNATATAKITVKHKPVATVFELTSGNATQKVTAGSSIEPIVYRYENVTAVRASGLPSGVTGVLDQSAKVFRIYGTVDAAAVAQDYVFTVEVTGKDENTSATGTITVERSSSSEASSSSIASSSSEKSSSSVASSSSEKSSSSVASSSSEVSSSSEKSSSSSKPESSSSVESSSSEVSSSSVVSSSSENTLVVVTGSLEQVVVRGEAFETITFSNVKTFERKSWNIWFLDFKQVGDVVTVEGSVHKDFPMGTSVETVRVNGQNFDITFDVTAPASSSSVESSSSETPVSSSSEGSSSSISPESSSSEGTTLAMPTVVSALSLGISGRTLHVAGAPDMSVEIFDMQGSPVASFRHVSGSVNLDMLRQGSFVVRLRAGSNSLIRRIVVK
jgi:hypothetical protein